MINSIRLINWRSHSDTSLEFRSGTNLLVGIMGAGKSSILEGISFALFGTFPALERRKLRMENIIRLNEPSAKVVLGFSWEGSAYRIEREIERTKRATSTKAEIFRDGALVENGTSSVNSYVENLTAVDYDLFTRAIYSEQNNIDYFLNLDPSRRKKEIDVLLGLDKFETARSNIVTVSGRVRTRKRALEENFSQEKIDELEKKEMEHGKGLAEAEKELFAAKSRAEENGKLLAALQSSFEKMRAQKELHDGLEKDLIRLSAQKESLEKNIVPVDEKVFETSRGRLAKLVEERNSQMENLKAVDTRSSGLSKRSGSLSAQIRAAKEAKARAEKLRAELSTLLGDGDVGSLQGQLTALEKDLLSFQSERQSISQQVAEISDVLSKLKPGMSECPLCSSTLDEKALSHIREERTSLISAKEKRLAELSSLLERSRDERAEIAKKLQRASTISSALEAAEPKDLHGLETQSASIAAEITQIEKERSAMRESIDSLSKDAETLRVEIRSAEESLKGMKRLAEIRELLGEAKSRLASLEFKADEFERLRGKAEAARLESERLRSSASSLESELRSSSEMLKAIRSELAGLRAVREKIKALYSLEEELALFRNALLETQVGLRSSLTDAINSAMNEIWPIFYPYHNYRALRLNVSEKDYVFEVNDGDWKSLDSIASGGERASAALTLRVALAMILTPRLSWLILDEPTHNLDSQAVELLSSALQFKVPEVVRQTFVITHDEAFMGSDFASSYRLSRDKEKNGPSIAEPI